jgi:hypothetical protein
VPSGQVWAGSPAKFLRNLMDGEEFSVLLHQECRDASTQLGFSVPRAAAQQLALPGVRALVPSTHHRPAPAPSFLPPQTRLSL